MASKRSVKRSIKNIQRVKTWQLVILLVLMMFVAATFMRLNNIGMTQRRDAVMDADKTGDQKVIRDRLIDLQNFVAAHMNTNGNEVYLTEQYERDRQKNIQAVVQERNAQAGQEVINQKVDEICKPQYSGYNQGYVDCFAREYAKFAPNTTAPVTQVKSPDPDSYRHVFTAPMWTPDFAGFSVVVCVIIIVVIVARILSLWLLKLLLRRHYQDI